MSEERIPPQRARDLFTRIDELLILLIETQKQQLEILRRLVPWALTPTETLEAVKEALAKVGKEDLAEKLVGELLLTSNQIGGLPIFSMPLSPRRLPPLPVLTAMVQVLGYDHHRFTTLSYTTGVGETEISDLDKRLEDPDILPEQIIVSPTTECRIDFDTDKEDVEIDSSTPSVLGDQSLGSPLHPRTIHHQAVSTSGTLKVFMYWR